MVRPHTRTMDEDDGVLWTTAPLPSVTAISEAANTSSLEMDDVVEAFPSGIAMSVQEAVGTALSLSFITVFTVVGNVLVICSVFNHRPLRTVQNVFLVSLALADIAVALLVMPFNVAYSIMGRWVFGLHFCELWLTCDVLCCTASILNLCAIALDRYWAIHDPINYAQKRTLRRVLLSIFLVWVISALISVPPLIGWNDWPEQFDETTPCRLTQETGYVLYSASGSFFIPLLIMSIVYLKIFLATRRRLRERANAAAKVPSSATRCAATAEHSAALLQERHPSSSEETPPPQHRGQTRESRPSLADTSVTLEQNGRPPQRQGVRLLGGASAHLSVTREASRPRAGHRDGSVRAVLAALLHHVRDGRLLRPLRPVRPARQLHHLARLRELGAEPRHIHRVQH
ncbi:hypothetical protein MTO96_016049 [Rhipicephalus appendiculatus]